MRGEIWWNERGRERGEGKREGKGWREDSEGGSTERGVEIDA